MRRRARPDQILTLWRPAGISPFLLTHPVLEGGGRHGALRNEVKRPKRSGLGEEVK